MQLENTKYRDGLDVRITYERKKAGDKPTIQDNAFGMDFNDFKRAIMLDSPPKKPTRSEFGMGLSIISLSSKMDFKARMIPLLFLAGEEKLQDVFSIRDIQKIMFDVLQENDADCIKICVIFWGRLPGVKPY